MANALHGTLVCKPKAMLFDLDGTLAHTLPQLSIAICKVADALHITRPTTEQMSSYVGNGVNMLIGRMLLGRHNIVLDEVDSELFKQAKDLFFQFYTQGLSENFVIYPGVKEGLAYFKKCNIRLGVVTNKPHTFAQPLIEYMGLSSFFGAVLGGEVLPTRKPDPAPLFHVLNQLQVDYLQEPQSIIMVGDSINDVLAGQNANFTTVAFTYGYNGGFDLRTSCSPNYLFDHFSDLTKLIEQLPD